MAVRAVGNIESDPCKLKWDGTDLGHTEGGVTVTIESPSRDRVVDEFGQTPVGIIHLGDTAEVTVPLAEDTIATLEAMLPAGATVSSTYRYFGYKPGKDLADFAKSLRIHPLRLSDDVMTQDLFFYKAVVTGREAVGFTAENDKVYGVTFRAIADTAETDGHLLGYWGGQA